MYTTYDIFDDVKGMRNWFDKFFDDRPYTRGIVEYPYVNLYEKDDNIDIVLLAPGEKVENLDIQLVDNSLIIKTNKQSDYKDEPYIRKERTFGNFKKSVKLPYTVNPNTIHAAIKDGILTIKLTKSDDVKPKKIEIH